MKNQKLISKLKNQKSNSSLECLNETQLSSVLGGVAGDHDCKKKYKVKCNNKYKDQTVSDSTTIANDFVSSTFSL